VRIIERTNVMWSGKVAAASGWMETGNTKDCGCCAGSQNRRAWSFPG